MKKNKLPYMACSVCGTSIKIGDDCETCSDCGAIFCKDCVNAGALKEHVCWEDDDDDYD